MQLYREPVFAFNHIEVFLLLLLQLAGLVVEVLDDFRGAVDRDKRRNVVEGRVAGQQS